MLETIGLISLYVFIAGVIMVMIGLGASARKNHKVNRQHPWVDTDTGVNMIPVVDNWIKDKHGEPVARSRMAVRQPLADLIDTVMHAPRPSRRYSHEASTTSATPTTVVPVQVPRAYTLPTPPPRQAPKTEPQTFVPVPLDQDGVPSWWRDHVGKDWRVPSPLAIPRHASVIRSDTNEQPLVAKVEYVGRHHTENAIGSDGQRALTESTGSLDMSKLYALLDSELVPA